MVQRRTAHSAPHTARSEAQRSAARLMASPSVGSQALPAMACATGSCSEELSTKTAAREVEQGAAGWS